MVLSNNSETVHKPNAINRSFHFIPNLRPKHRSRERAIFYSKMLQEKTHSYNSSAICVNYAILN